MLCWSIFLLAYVLSKYVFPVVSSLVLSGMLEEGGDDDPEVGLHLPLQPLDEHPVYVQHQQAQLEARLVYIGPGSEQPFTLGFSLTRFYYYSVT